MSRTIVTLLGDPYHEAEALQTFTERLFEADHVIHCSVDNLDEMLQNKPDLFLLSKENRLTKQSSPTWLTEELDSLIDTYVRKGGRLFVLHSGLSSYPEDSKVRALSKGHFVSHPSQLIEVTIDSLLLLDEHYFVEVDKTETEILFQSSSTEGSSFAAWRHRMDDGKVLCFTPTHTKEAMEQTDFLSFTKNLVTWLEEDKE